MSWRERHLANVQRLEDAATRVVMREMDKVLARVTRGFAATTAAAGDEPADAAGSLDDVAAARPMWVSAVDGTIVPWFAEVFEAGGAAAVAQIAEVLDRDVPGVDRDLMREAASWFLSQTRPRFVELGDEMAARAQAELLESFQAGESIAKTRRRLRSVTDLTRAAAEMVARTQVIAASNAGAAARTSLMPDDAKPRYKVWLSTLDGRTRPTHVSADGQAVLLDELFSVGAASMAYPGDPAAPAEETANCRCTQIYTDEPQLPDVEGRQRGRPGGIVDETDTPPASAVPYMQGGPIVPDKVTVNLPAGTRIVDVAHAVARNVNEAWRASAGWTPDAEDLAMAETDLAAANVDSVTGEVHTGSMIALLPSEADAERLALDGGESTEQLHVTMWFLGEADAIPEGLRAAIRSEIEDRASTFKPIEAKVFGAAVWNPDGERGGSLNWNVGGPPDLEDFRSEMRTGLISAPDWVEGDDASAAQAWEMVENHSPWAAHMCAMYAETEQLTEALPAALERVGEITLDRVRLTFGAEVIDIPLGTSQDADVPEEDTTMVDATTAAAPKPPPGKKVSKAPNGQCPPGYRPDPDDDGGCISTTTPAQDAAAPPSPPPGKRVKQAPNGSCPPGYRDDGEGGCISESTPEDDETAAAPPGAPVGPSGGCPPGQHRVGGECIPMDDGEEDEEAAEAMKPQPLTGEHFRATMHVQNVSTGRRTFRNLEWRQPPFAFHRQKNSSAHGGIPEVVQTGLVTRVVADGETLYGFGHLDLDGDEGLEHGRRLVMGFDRWVSIGLDEQPSNIEVEWPEVDEDEDGNPMSALLMEPEQIIFDGGRIGELTSVSVPAQDEATLEPTPELIREMEARMGAVKQDPAEVVTASVVGSTDLPVADRDHGWDGTGAMNRVWAAANDGADTAAVSRAFLYRDPNADPKTKAAWKLGFADIVDGTLKIIPRGVAAAAGGRGVNRAQVPEDEKARIRSKICTLYTKVRNVHDDWPDCPFSASAASEAVGHAYEMADAVQAVTAAAHQITISETPPRWWYDEPTDVEITSALNITNEGRLYGALAPLGTGHRAFANSGRRLEVPFGRVDYDRFMGAWAITSKGKIAAGPVTMDCGHAPRFRADHDVAPAHYENSCTAFATVRVGESRERGVVWVAGALLPGVTADLVSRALACRLSGDWQPHPDKPGWQELIAALLVPSPGFPMGHQGPSLSVGDEIDVGDGVLVASSVHAEVPVRAVAPPAPTLRIDPGNRRVARVVEEV